MNTYMELEMYCILFEKKKKSDLFTLLENRGLRFHFMVMDNEKCYPFHWIKAFFPH